LNELRKDLRASCADGAAWSVMVGVGESYLPAFVLALTASQLASGLVATVPMLAGAVLQLISPYAVRRLHSYRRWVVSCAVIQALAFVPLFVGSTTGSIPLVLVFVIASLYWGAGLATLPAWNAWVETLVPKRLRARFFARRTRLTQLGLLAGFVGGGLILQAGAKSGAPLSVFAILFLIASAGRLISAYYLGSQREPRPPGNAFPGLEPARLLRAARHNAHTRVLLYMIGAQMAAWIAGPYFTPYMFVHLGLSYWGFVVLVCAAFLSKIAFLPALGRVAQRWGAQRMLWTSGLLIVPVPALWLLNQHFVYLLVLQVLSGASWAAFELAMLLLFFETIPSEKRLTVLTMFNLASAAAIALGSFIGGVLLSAFASTPEAYVAIFTVSAIARATSLLLLLRMPTLAIRLPFVATRAIAVRPSMGSIERPVLSGLRDMNQRFGLKKETATMPMPLPQVEPAGCAYRGDFSATEAS
jgi:MFS family permease